MKILITGGRGFIGEKLILALLPLGYDLVFLSRSPKAFKEVYGDQFEYYQWNSLSGLPPKEAFKNVSIVINLMGEGIARKRWSKNQKKLIRETRVQGTQNLVEGIIKYANQVELFLSASAVGYYDQSAKGYLTENSRTSDDYLSLLCKNWEKEAFKVSAIRNIRAVCFRIGFVLGDGGALSKMALPFLLGLGGILGSGKQWMNWIHIEDVVQMFIYAIENKELSGAYNAVSPNNVTNQEFSIKLGKVLHRPSFMKVPGFALKLLVGEFSNFLLKSGNVTPDRIQNTSFKFKYSNLESALEEALNIKFIEHLNQKVRCSCYQIIQYLPYSLDEIFSFFSDAKNLERITPPHLNFNILSQSTKNIAKGTLFTYKLKLRKIPLRWKTNILEWNPKTSFIDTQIKGPYRVWRHHHLFIPTKKGVWMQDTVHFALPKIPLISFFLMPFVKKEVREIFEYRKKHILGIFKSEEVK